MTAIDHDAAVTAEDADASSDRVGARHRVALLVLATAGLAALVLWRSTPSPMRRVWAEDGPIFLQAAILDSPWHNVLSPYAGYAHVVPRLVAEVVVALPPTSWAAAIALASAAIRVALVVVAWYATREHIPSAGWRYVLAIAALIMPVAQLETLDNLANLHWFLDWAAVLCAMWSPPTRRGAVVRCAVMALAVLCDPLAAAVVLPILVVRALRRRTTAELIALGVGLLASAIQFIVVLGARAQRAAHGDLTPLEMGRSYIGRVVFGAFSGSDLASAVYPVTVGFAAVTCLVLALTARGIVFRGPQRSLAAVCTATSVVLYVAVTFGLSDRAAALGMVPGAELVVGAMPRYTVVAALLLLTAVVSGASVVARDRRAAIAWWVCGGLLGAWYVVGVVTAVGDFELTSAPPWPVAVEAARVACVQGALGEISVPVEPAQWPVMVPCSMLERS